MQPGLTEATGIPTGDQYVAALTAFSSFVKKRKFLSERRVLVQDNVFSVCVAVRFRRLRYFARLTDFGTVDASKTPVHGSGRSIWIDAT